jgi:CheY-like chemotaxis protein
MQKRKKILLVDDDEDFVEIHRTILEPKYEVAVAYSAQEGLALVEANDFDLFILDIMMEDRDSGFQLTYQIRNHPKYENVPIMLLTSAPKVTGFSFDLEKDKDWIKADALIEKPVSTPYLLKKVEELLGTNIGK